MVGTAVNTDWGVKNTNLKPKVILNMILCVIRDKTTCISMWMEGLGCLRSTAANRGQCVTKYQARAPPVFIGGGES